MDSSGLVRLISAANSLGGRGNVSPELMGVRSAAVRVGAALTRRLIPVLTSDDGRSFDLAALGGLVGEFDGLIVDGDGLSKALTDTDIVLVSTLRNEITRCMGAYPDGDAMAASVERSPTAQAARSLAEGAIARLSHAPPASKPTHPNPAPDPTAEVAAVAREAVPLPAALGVGDMGEHVPIANNPIADTATGDNAGPTSFGLLSRALMHLHDAIGGKVAPGSVEDKATEKPDKNLNALRVPLQIPVWSAR